MSTTSKVSASSAASASAAPSRITADRGSSHFDRIDGITGTSLGVSDPWRRTYNENSSDGFGSLSQDNRKDDNPQNQFTQLVKLAAASYPASENNQEFRASAPTFIADLMRGVGVYEINMKICSGVFRNQGSVINRYS